MNYLQDVISKRKPAGSVKAWTMKLVFSRVGPIITGFVSSIVGYAISVITAKLDLIGVTVNADMQMEVAGFLSFIIYGAINYLINKYAGDSAAALQEALSKSSGVPLDVDKWIDIKTIEAARNTGSVPKPPPAQ